MPGMAPPAPTSGETRVPWVISARSVIPRLKSAIAVLTALASGSVVVYMLYRGILWMMISVDRGITSTTVMKTPLWIPNFFVVFGLALFVLAILLFTVRQAINVVGSVSSQSKEEGNSTGGPT